MAAEPPPHLPPEPGRSHEEQENGVAEPSTGDFTASFLGRDGLVWLRATLLAPLSVLGGGVTGACGVLWGQGLSFGCGGQVSGTCGHWSQA